MAIKVGFDAKRLFQNYTGLGNYSRTLVKNLTTFHDDVECHLFAPRLTDNETTRFFLQQDIFKNHTPTYDSLGALWRTAGLNATLQKEKINLFHGLSHEIPINIKSTKIPTIVTMHDLIFKVYPSYYPTFQRHIYDWKFRFACDHADKIVAISKQTKADIVGYYGIDEEKIEVIYQTCDARFQRPITNEEITTAKKKYNLPDNYLLYVGSIIERKNLMRLVQALRQLPSSLDIPLVVVGDGKDYKKQVLAYIQQHRLTQRIIFVPSIIYAELPAIYAGASIFIYPSEYEGFGIPIIEALFTQVPVITSDCSCLPEAAGEKSMLINPQSVEEITFAIEKVLVDKTLQDAMKIAGLSYANTNFSSEKVTQDMYNLYQSML